MVRVAQSLAFCSLYSYVKMFWI